ncbi:outer membrane beta-barrel protein [Polaribacter sp. MSW13]|uniref:Outer membrane beta-barrel protein n=1 Tax=Polaribacter marinus TaxID=2916838 RepID=A0A9X1VSI8_9FLAO|nr:outer membrane beta-barrel protein [Polaribacter marinus]MCI2230212.1 outer membrane beta-barrel protein [Polaribacter marinus]
MKFLNIFTELKHRIVLLFCLVLVQFSYAQSDSEKVIPKLKFSVGTELMTSKVQLNNSSLENPSGFGFGVNLGISYRLNTKFSLFSGLGFNRYKSKITLDSYSSFENSVDMSGEDFEFRYEVQNFSEEQNYSAISIPIAIQYETTGNFRFYSKVGFEANFFVSQKYESKAEKLTTTGYFPRINAELTQPTFAGFGSFENQKFISNDFKVKNSFNATLEAGVKQILKSGNSLYVGVFTKLGLNTLSSDMKSGLVSYNSEEATAFLSTSILQAIDRQRSSSNQFAQAKLRVFGIAFRYEFSL